MASLSLARVGLCGLLNRALSNEIRGTYSPTCIDHISELLLPDERKSADSTGSAKLYVYPRMAQLEPGEWTGRDFKVIQRLDVSVDFCYSYATRTFATGGWMRDVANRLGVRVWKLSFWFQPPQSPPVRITYASQLDKLGIRDGDVIIVTDDGAAPPAAITSPCAPKIKLTSRLKLTKLECAAEALKMELCHVTPQTQSFETYDSLICLPPVAQYLR